MMRTALIAVLLGMLAACSIPNEPAAFKALPADGWAYGHTLSFDDVYTDSVEAKGRIAIAVRHTDAYHYSNLWLELSMALSDSTERVDTVNIVLADTYGNWQGRGSGASYLITDTVDIPYTFNRNHPPRLRHIMRLDTVREIEQVGLIILK